MSGYKISKNLFANGWIVSTVPGNTVLSTHASASLARRAVKRYEAADKRRAGK